MNGSIISIIPVIVIILVVLGVSLKVINEYERGVILTLGKFTSIKNPGLRLVIPIIQQMFTVDMRQRTIKLEPQSVMTKDQVNLTIDGVVFYRVSSAKNAILNVTNITEQLEAKATSELKEIIGSLAMSQALTKRAEIADKLIASLNEAIKDKDGYDWGVVVSSIQINNLELPEELVRAMAKQAEAEREKEARKTKADGEFQAAHKFSEAAKLYREAPEALKLRELQTYQEIGTEQNTLMLVIPQGMAHESANWALPFLTNEFSKSSTKSSKGK